LQTTSIVDKLDIDPLKTFAFVLFLFVLEDVLVKVELKVFIGIVDAKLFKTAVSRERNRKKNIRQQ